MKTQQGVAREEAAGPCIFLKRLIDRRNRTSFEPFSWLSVCYCSPDFSRADIVSPPLQADRETFNYLVTGLVDPPELLDERANGGSVLRWIDIVGGLKQAEPSQSVHVLDVEVWVELPQAVTAGGAARWELESEQVPLVRTSDGEVRVLCGEFQGREGVHARQAKEILMLDITLFPGGVFEHFLPQENTTFLYVFGGKIDAGKELEVSCGRDALLRVYGGNVFASSQASGGRFLLFSAKPFSRETGE